jgi:hypothetical protein
LVFLVLLSKQKNHFLCIKKLQKLLIYICLILFGARCAQITPLTGGKKDETPPKALSYSPENASLNFNSKVIQIQFNEYITVKDIANQLIITPQTKEIPDIQAQGKTLKIEFSETLLPNTTYKLAFGSAISDLNESNTLQNFEYIFSTGQVIDSLKLGGNILNAFDKKPASQILIGLYNAEASDSVIYKEKPLYISKTNEAGEFKFNYLPDTPFKIVGIKDQNKNLLYDGSEEQIAFTKELVKPTDSISINLLLFKEIPTKSFIKKSYSPEYGKAFIIYNKPQLNIKDVVANGLIQYKQNTLKDTLTLYYTNKFDTLETYVKYENKEIDTVYVRVISQNIFEKQNKGKSIKYNLQPNFSSVLPFYEMPSFELNVPIDSKSISADKIRLFEETDSVTKVMPFEIIKGNDMITSFKIQSQFKPETNYTLTLQKAAVSDDSQRMNDSITYQFKTTIIDDYAQLKMKLLFPKKENYLVRRLLNDKEQLINEE